MRSIKGPEGSGTRQSPPRLESSPSPRVLPIAFLSTFYLSLSTSSLPHLFPWLDVLPAPVSLLAPAERRECLLCILYCYCILIPSTAPRLSPRRRLLRLRLKVPRLQQCARPRLLPARPQQYLLLSECCSLLNSTFFSTTVEGRPSVARQHGPLTVMLRKALRSPMSRLSLTSAWRRLLLTTPRTLLCTVLCSMCFSSEGCSYSDNESVSADVMMIR